MLICVGVLFLILTCGNASYVTNNGEVFKTHVDNVYMQWPSYKNDAKLHILKREAILLTQNNPEEENKKLLVVNSESESKPPVGLSEGGSVNVNPPTNNSLSESPKSQEPTQLLKTSNVTDIKDQNGSVPLNSPKITDTKNITKAAINDTKPPQNITIAATNATTTDSDNLLPINNPGVVKRGLIVFGGFAILAAAYFIFYRKKNNKYDTNSTHNANDANQFRYGVLQSDDRRDNLELARIPLTMESDDDDEDEDLEIFDLEQKKKSLSYVNLQVNDEDIVLNGSKDESKNNLLLDIEDGPSDTLINWSSNGNKSIL